MTGIVIKLQVNLIDKYKLIPIFFLLVLQFSNAQIIIKGNIVDQNKNPLNSASVILKDSTNKHIITYTITNQEGFYELSIQNPQKTNLSVSSLGYEKQTKEVDASNKFIEVNFLVKEAPLDLDEVLIRAESPIYQSNDTVRIKTKYFSDGTEANVEELLQKIPGLRVDNEGKIMIGNQEIEKLMVDGDDFFEKGYKVLSKNMPAYPIEEVEILKNYSNNRLLRGIEESNKVALNLKLDEKSKRVWFGNINGGYGINEFYELRGNLMNFGKKNKYYFLTNLNNIGYDATGDLNYLIHPIRTDEPASIGDDQQINPLLDLRPLSLNFREDRTNFNNAKLLSLNAIFNPTEKLKIKPLIFLNWDETDFYRNSVEEVNTANADFTNIENYSLRNKKMVTFGKIDLTYNISKTKMLETTTKFNQGDFRDYSNLIFNNTSTIENLNNQNKLFDQKIIYTNKFKDKKVFLLSGRFINEETPNNYKLNRYFYEDLFPESPNANNVAQDLKQKMLYGGIDAHLLNRRKKGKLFELQVGNEFRQDKLSSNFMLLHDEDILNTPDNFQNNTIYQTNDLYIKSKYRFEISDFAIIGKIEFHQFFNKLENTNITENENPFFINPSLGAEWKINNKNKLRLNYSFSSKNSEILDVYDNYVLTSYRSFNRGTGNFNQLQSSSIVFNYELGNWSDRFFANTFLIYSKNYDFFSTASTIQPNFNLTEKILFKDRNFLSFNTKIDYYIKKISSNLKIDLSYSNSGYRNIVNDVEREVRSQNFGYGLELRSGFMGIFNYHLGTKWTTNRIETSFSNSFTNNLSFLDLSFVFNDKIDLSLQTERYEFGNLNENNIYYFLDLDATYKIIKNKLSISATGKNIFDTVNFRNISISDIGTSKTEYRLLPRMLLIKIEYRF
ncbi:MAG: hypothetical protein CMP12_21715 [Zunongwangia sp.]|uniref:carboxypeptidase-like regulatory domain-containing protein n=1 Tax=Zunongwangia profunda TaxID=398743 RepID=UPI000C97205C|nr:carboxypeptidase-like regulatory domain-containing protein [Zunongwangia profunda]MAO38479.1 hypothetical protein [Zunongwangia sp.]|tara:strand:+ start:1443 stop:4133 length:2691 start_codon:yes stop_codon:yes gene_type:complete